jgi:hypothetical protein
VSVHSKPAGDVPDAVKERLRTIVPPGPLAPEDRLRFAVCAHKSSHGEHVLSASTSQMPQRRSRFPVIRNDTPGGNIFLKFHLAKCSRLMNG